MSGNGDVLSIVSACWVFMVFATAMGEQCAELLLHLAEDLRGEASLGLQSYECTAYSTLHYGTTM